MYATTSSWGDLEKNIQKGIFSHKMCPELKKKNTTKIHNVTMILFFKYYDIYSPASNVMTKSQKWQFFLKYEMSFSFGQSH